MRILIKTPVSGDPASIMPRFDKALFEQLTPPGVGVELVRFDGSRKGDVVHIRLRLAGFITQDWISDIIEDGSSDQEAWFVDQGRVLPFFLREWRHVHRVVKTETGSEIVDDIFFKSPRWLPGFLLYPVLYLQFAGRKPVYQAVFGKG